jgi:hypothetical protein
MGNFSSAQAANPVRKSKILTQTPGLPFLFADFGAISGGKQARGTPIFGPISFLKYPAVP